MITKEKITALLEKKQAYYKDKKNSQQKLMRSLISKGYTYSEIKQVIQETQ